MASVNKVILVGNLGADPETRYSTDGAAITNIRMATTDRWKDKGSGEMREQTEWHRVVFFGRLAEIAGEYLKKRIARLRRGTPAHAQVDRQGRTRPVFHRGDRRQHAAAWQPRRRGGAVDARLVGRQCASPRWRAEGTARARGHGRRHSVLGATRHGNAQILRGNRGIPV